MRGVVFEDAAGGVVDEDEAFLPAYIGERERADNIGADGLDLVRLAPVDVGAAGDAGGVEDVSRLDGGDVGLEVDPVLEAARPVDVVDALGLAELAEQAAYPAGAAVDQELEVLSRRAVGGGAHGDGGGREAQCVKMGMGIEMW